MILSIIKQQNNNKPLHIHYGLDTLLLHINNLTSPHSWELGVFVILIFFFFDKEIKLAEE